jgi:hypothetical protein
MGSACTFPVETILFLGIALSALLFVRGLKPTQKNFIALAGEVRVFGDDVIIPEDAGTTFIELLEHFAFKVNQNKTHATGYFRESCGLEAYKGVDVTPAYILQFPEGPRPESIAGMVATTNNFFWKGWWHAAVYLQSTIPYQIGVVEPDSGAFGYESPTARYLRPPVRWNKYLHHWESKRTTLKVRSPRNSVEGYGPLLQYFTENPSPDSPWKSGVGSRPRIKIRREWVEERRVPANLTGTLHLYPRAS